MAAFCRPRVAFENENDAFWIREAEAQSLLLLMAFCQRLGDVFMACSYRVEERTADAPKLAFATLDWGVFVFEGASDASRCDRCVLWD
jgi:hypothetical protein